MNTCRDCRWCQITDSEYTGVYHFLCRRSYTVNHVTGDRSYANCGVARGYRKHCDQWERGGLVGFIKRLFKTKRNV